MRRVLSSFGPTPEFDGEAAARINKVCERNWRNNALFIDELYEYSLCCNVTFLIYLGDLWVYPKWPGESLCQKREKGSAADEAC